MAELIPKTSLTTVSTRDTTRSRWTTARFATSNYRKCRCRASSMRRRPISASPSRANRSPSSFRRRPTRGATTSSSCSAQPALKAALRSGSRRARSCPRSPCCLSLPSSRSFSSGASRARFKIYRTQPVALRPAISIFACRPHAAPTRWARSPASSTR